MDRMGMIKAKFDKDNYEKEMKILKQTLELKKLEDKILEYQNDIETICNLADRIKEYGYEINGSYEFNGNGRWVDLIAEGIYHHLGLYIRDKNIKGVGIKNGGACGYWDIFVTPNGDIVVQGHDYEGKNKYKLLDITNVGDLKKMVAELPRFIEGFYKWFDEFFKEG